MRLAAQAKGGFYPTPPTVSNIINTTLYARTDNVRKDESNNIHVLDPCCGEGDALADVIKTSKNRYSRYERHNLITYGVETNKDRAEVAETKLDNVLNASIFNTSIANNSFQLLFLNPPYDMEAGQDRVEVQFLQHCTRYLAPYGTLVYIVPRNVVPHAANFLATHYSSVKIAEFPRPELERFDQVVVVATKKSYAMMMSDVLAQLIVPRHDLHSLDSSTTSGWYYTLFPTNTEKMLFTQRVIDPQVAAAEARERGIWANEEFTMKMWPPELQHTRPLMPLRQGHLAMLIAAGFLNNMEIETDEGPILVKGRATKKMKVAQEDEKQVVEREQLTTKVTTLNLKTGEFSELQTEAE